MANYQKTRKKNKSYPSMKNKKILDLMSTYVLPSDQSKYCLGIFHFDMGFNAYYHGGWWGTDVIYSPETDATISVFTLQKSFQHQIIFYTSS